MYVRLVLWDLGDSPATIEQLRDYIAGEATEAFGAVEGLPLKMWISDPETNRWGAVYLWESREAAQQTLPSRARELIGKDPDEVREFDLEASVRAVSDVADLHRLGLAFGR